MSSLSPVRFHDLLSGWLLAADRQFGRFWDPREGSVHLQDYNPERLATSERVIVEASEGPRFVPSDVTSPGEVIRELEHRLEATAPGQAGDVT